MPLEHYWSSFLLSQIFTQELPHKNVSLSLQLEYQERPFIEKFYDFVDMFKIYLAMDPVLSPPNIYVEALTSM